MSICNLELYYMYRHALTGKWMIRGVQNADATFGNPQSALLSISTMGDRGKLVETPR